MGPFHSAIMFPLTILMPLRPLLVTILLFVGSLVAAADLKPVHVAMIFDDGPDPVQTPRLLALFAEEQVHVTFGTVGKHAEAHPELIKAAVAAGHEVANHSYSHQNPQGLADTTLENEILGGEATIAKAAGVAPTWYWPPFIAIDDRVRADTAKAGIKIYIPRKLAVSGDYMKEVTADEIFRRATTGIEDGTVILFHEWRADTETELKAIIGELRKQGCVFLTFSEMDKYLAQ
jgi:peptidoglycan/xylan/chitin deacetylase (PgdA/CDA1 family)